MRFALVAKSLSDNKEKYVRGKSPGYSICDIRFTVAFVAEKTLRSRYSIILKLCVECKPLSVQMSNDSTYTSTYPDA